MQSHDVLAIASLVSSTTLPVDFMVYLELCYAKHSTELVHDIV